MTSAGATALAGLKVFDLSRRHGHYCGKLLADLGAQVTLVEPPGGGRLRAEPPFIGGQAGTENGIHHIYLNTSKRGITLDLDCAEGQTLFRSLAATADLVIEDLEPGGMARRGLGYETLSGLNPRIVVTSITNFGQTGPYAGYAADDLTLLAMGGLLHLMGYEDAAPTQAAGRQAWAMGCMFGAVGSMLALLEAQASGSGQQVDVSIQECVVMALETAAQAYDLEHRIRARTGLSQQYAGSGIFPCADGHVYILTGGLASHQFWGKFVAWMRETGVAGAERLAGEQWRDRQFVESAAAKEIFAEVFGAYARGKSKQYLYAQAQAQRIPLCPVSTPEDIANNAQLASRGFMVSVLHEATGRTVRMPGAPYKLSATPWSLQGPAPELGADNLEVFAEIGQCPAQLAQLAARGVI